MIKENNERSYKEERIRSLTMPYYLRSDVKKALLDFSLSREVVPRYFEGFGKRPDTFQYESDIIEQVRRGATSFHCSEELWKDPLEISTEMSKKDLDEIRLGWDLLLDIDSPYLEYSKIYATLLVDALIFHGIKNLGVKFSGSKGFHIIVPWSAFPKEVFNNKLKDMFPEYPRIICQYLTSVLQPKLADKIFEMQSLKDLAKWTGRTEEELVITECLSCKRPAIKKYLVTWVCNNCSSIGDIVRLEKNKRIPHCPECRREMIEKSRKDIFACESCNISSDKDPELFSKTRAKTEALIEADLILVSSRHLFRMPYSLHEKTALSSIVLDKNKIMDFQITDARPLSAKIKEYYPKSKENEAKNLLLQALHWKEQQENDTRIIKEIVGNNRLEAKANTSEKPKQKDGEYKQIEIRIPTSDLYPPQIKLLLKGVKNDGRKRALFILLSYFFSLGSDHSFIEKTIDEWNKLNYQPLKQGYISSQIQWYKNQPRRLPPNFDNTLYRELGVDKDDPLVKQTKNPVSYTIKKYFMKNH